MITFCLWVLFSVATISNLMRDDPTELEQLRANLLFIGWGLSYRIGDLIDRISYR